MVQKLNRNWLSVQNEEFEKFWSELLKIPKSLPFNGLLLIKVYNVWAKKSIEDLCLMVLNIGAKFKGKLLALSKMTYHDISQLKNKAPHFSSFFFFFSLCIFLKVISQFCISKWPVRRKLFSKLLWLFQLGIFVIFAIYLASICILLLPLLRIFLWEIRFKEQ